jgi:hypothetical protein
MGCEARCCSGRELRLDQEIRAGDGRGLRPPSPGPSSGLDERATQEVDRPVQGPLKHDRRGHRWPTRRQPERPGGPEREANSTEPSARFSDDRIQLVHGAEDDGIPDILDEAIRQSLGLGDRRRDLGGWAFGGLAWSPDGLEIAFTRDMQDTASTSRTTRTFVLDLASGKVRELPIPAGICAGEPAWSPDDSRIVVTAGMRAGLTWECTGGRAGLDIYAIRPDGTDFRQLTTDGLSSGATWTPDGSQISFIRENDLWLMDPDGSNATLLLTCDILAGSACAESGTVITAALWQPLP